jgi:hypothetical protein
MFRLNKCVSFQIQSDYLSSLLILFYNKLTGELTASSTNRGTSVTGKFKKKKKKRCLLARKHKAAPSTNVGQKLS